MNMDISMDIHRKSVDMDMDMNGKFISTASLIKTHLGPVR